MRNCSSCVLVVALAFGLGLPDVALAGAPVETAPGETPAASDAPIGEPTEEAAEGSTDEPADEPAGEPVEATTDEPTGEPVEAAAEQPVLPAEAVMPPPPVAPTRMQVDPRNYGMVLAGNIVIGLGGAGLVAMAIGLGIRQDALTQRQGLIVGDSDPDALAHQDQRLQRGTTVALVGGIGALGLFATGITLVALGYARERKRRLALPQAVLGRDQLGLSWSFQF